MNHRWLNVDTSLKLEFFHQSISICPSSFFDPATLLDHQIHKQRRESVLVFQLRISRSFVTGSRLRKKESPWSVLFSPGTLGWNWGSSSLTIKLVVLCRGRVTAMMISLVWLKGSGMKRGRCGWGFMTIFIFTGELYVSLYQMFRLSH